MVRHGVLKQFSFETPPNMMWLVLVLPVLLTGLLPLRVSGVRERGIGERDGDGDVQLVSIHTRRSLSRGPSSAYVNALQQLYHNHRVANHAQFLFDVPRTSLRMNSGSTPTATSHEQLSPLECDRLWAISRLLEWPEGFERVTGTACFGKVRPLLATFSLDVWETAWEELRQKVSSHRDRIPDLSPTEVLLVDFQQAHTPLLLADPDTSLVGVHLLLQAGALVDLPSWVAGGRSALQVASASGDLPRVALLYQWGAEISRQDGRRGRTAFLEACMHGHAGVMRFLLEHGASVEDVSPDGRSCVSELVRQRNWNTVWMLVREHSAKVEHGDLVEAMERGIPMTLFRQVLLRHKQHLKEPWRLLQHASRRGFLQAATVLLEVFGGISSDCGDPETGRFALHWAAEEGNLKMVQLLLAWSADPMVQDSQGKLAIQLAREHAQWDTYQCLRLHMVAVRKVTRRLSLVE